MRIEINYFDHDLTSSDQMVLYVARGDSKEYFWIDIGDKVVQININEFRAALKCIEDIKNG